MIQLDVRHMVEVTDIDPLSVGMRGFGTQRGVYKPNWSSDRWLADSHCRCRGADWHALSVLSGNIFLSRSHLFDEVSVA